jgi:periplasmic divalent cation tolerance protein
MTNPVKLLYVTCQNVDEARRIGRQLIAERLAGCINIFPTIESIYKWDAAVETTLEAVMIVKTSEHLTEVCSLKIRELHSYKTPCVLMIPVENTDDDYIRWLQGQLPNR